MLRWEEQSNAPDPWSGITFALRPSAAPPNAAPNVSLTSPANNATFTAPASIILTADAQDTDGTVTQVEFFQGATLVATDTAAPFSFTLTNVAAGSYSFTAKATDNLGATTTSAAVSVTVNAAAAAQLYFIHPDHLNTPRLITNNVGQAVWRWDQTDPFGGNPPNENPSGLGTFTCNLRLPGQYFDKETNTHYNYFRDYDPGIGRYIQPDPLGLDGGVNIYAYGDGSPIAYVDPDGSIVLVPWAAGIGAVLGGFVNGFQTLTDPCFNGDWRKVARNVAWGVLIGAAAGVAVGTGVPQVWGWGGGLVAGAVTGGANAAATGGSPGAIVTQAAIGAVAGGVGSVYGIAAARVAYWSQLPVTSAGRLAAINTAAAPAGLTSAAVFGRFYNTFGNLFVPSGLGGLNQGRFATSPCECQR